MVNRLRVFFVPFLSFPFLVFVEESDCQPHSQQGENASISTSMGPSSSLRYPPHIWKQSKRRKRNQKIQLGMFHTQTWLVSPRRYLCKILYKYNYSKEQMKMESDEDNFHNVYRPPLQHKSLQSNRSSRKLFFSYGRGINNCNYSKWQSSIYLWRGYFFLLFHQWESLNWLFHQREPLDKKDRDEKIRSS